MPGRKAKGASGGDNLHRDPEKKPSVGNEKGRQFEDEDSSLMEAGPAPASVLESRPALLIQAGLPRPKAHGHASRVRPRGFFDWEYSDWPLERAVLDGHTAEKVGGFLKRYKALRNISTGDGVIPNSFKV